MNAIVRQIKLPFATLEFYETYVVCKIKQGAVLNLGEIEALHEVYREHFGGSKYGLIFDRTTDYTIDPIGYMQCPYYADVTAFVVVAPNPTTKLTVAFEQKFAKRELKIFDTLEGAQDWMESVTFQ